MESTVSAFRSNPDKQTQLAQAWREIREIARYATLGEYWALLMGAKPAIAYSSGEPQDQSQSMAEALHVQNILKKYGIQTEVFGSVLFRPDVLNRRVRDEVSLARDCSMLSKKDQGRFHIACIMNQGALDDPTGTLAKQYGFALGFPKSAIDGFTRWAQIAEPFVREEKLFFSPDSLCCTDEEWKKWKNEELSKLPHNIQEKFEKIRFLYKGFQATQSQVPERFRLEYEMDQKDTFLRQYSELIASLYRDIGFSEDDATFAASGRNIVITTPDGSDYMYQFMTWNYPTREHGIVAEDARKMRQAVQQQVWKYRDIW